MKKAVYLILLLTSTLVLAQNQTLTLNDGPYILKNREVVNLSEGELSRLVLQRTDKYVAKDYFGDSLDLEIDLDREISSTAFDSASKFFAISDFHGEYENMVELLKVNNIINDGLDWIFGEGRLVIVGDMMDRGDKVTEILWLIYKLEHEAELAGGKVHFLLGNHEIMVLQGDLRYINDKYQSLAIMMGLEFNQFFAAGTLFGDWLRSKKVMLKLNDILFVHAGISPEIIRANLDMESINRMIIDSLDLPKEQRKADSTLALIYGSFGPIWYRGFLMKMEKYPQISSAQLDSVLSYYEVKQVIVGHSVIDSIETYFDNKIFAINIDYTETEAYQGLYWHKGQYKVCDITGRERIIIE